jgi:hypothetical protein
MKNISKVLLILSFALFYNVNAQKNSNKEKKKYNYFLVTTNTDDIEEFLSTANHEDPRYPLAKHRLVELKNANWMKNGPVTFMAARPVSAKTEIASKFVLVKQSLNEEEFQALIKENQKDHNAKTVNLLNSMFNPDLNSDEKIVLVQNRSSCNIILSLKGVKLVKLAVPAKGEDFAVVKKGEYNLETNVCGVAYKSIKNFQNNQILTLEEPVMMGKR